MPPRDPEPSLPPRRRTEGGRWSWAEDRRLIELAGTLKSLEAVAKKMGRKPEAVAKSARRLGISLKSQAKPNADDA